MLNFIYGALGVVFALGLIAGGFVLGWKGHKKFTEEQVKQFKADKVAFDTMLAYNAATAYGTDRGLDDLLKGDD